MKRREQMFPDERFGLAIKTMRPETNDIKGITEKYFELRNAVMLHSNLSNGKVDEFLVKAITDSLLMPASKELKEHILNKG